MGYRLDSSFKSHLLHSYILGKLPWVNSFNFSNLGVWGNALIKNIRYPSAKIAKGIN